jgi:hypothetical protein
MNVLLKQGKEIDRTAWLAFLAHSPQGAVYVHPDYLDLVAEGWQAIEVWRDNHLLAIMPLAPKQKAGYTYALQPSFSQYWGILLADDDLGTAYKTYSHRRKVIKAVVEAIPQTIKWFRYGFAPEFDYPHPFHWAGYALTTRYTYRLDMTAGYAVIKQGFGNDIRYDMRKAAGAGIDVRVAADGNGLLQLVRDNAAHGKQLLQPAEIETLERLTSFLPAAQLGYLLEVVAADGSLLGAALFGSYAGKTAYLMSAQAPGKTHAGAMTLLLAHAIERAAGTDRIFDFEGSMIEGIEGFFRGFGGRPVPYLMIEKNALPLPIRWIRKLR